MKYCRMENGQRCAVPAPDTAFDFACDVCVAGLGTAGSMAAIAAARQGVRVIGVEQQNVMGGIPTRGCVNTYYYGTRGGLFEEINRACIALTRDARYADSAVDNRIQVSVSPAVKAYVLQKTALDAGCTLLLDAVVTGVFTDDEGDTVLGVSVLSEGKHLHIRAQIVIDSTRDAAVCAAADCGFLDGRYWDGRHMMYSKGVCTVSDERPNLDRAAWYHYDFRHLPLNLGRSLVKLSWVNDRYFDAQNPIACSDALLKSNAGEPFASEHYDAENKIVSLASALGVRETREVETETVYTFDDFAKCKKADDILYYTFAPLDTTSPDPAFEGDDLLDWRLLCGVDCGFSVGIPRGVLIPKGKRGLLVASKAFGVGHTLCGAVRMKADMEKCGEAAGVLAALAIETGRDVRDADYTTLRTRLSESGCCDESANRGYDGNDVSLSHPPQRICFAQTVQQIKEALDSFETAGRALWTIRNRTCDAQVYALLPTWYESTAGSDSVFAYNCAAALLLACDRRGAAVFARALTRMDLSADLRDGKSTAHLIKTIYLAGKAAEPEAVEPLMRLLETYAKDVSPAAYRVASFAMIALLRIALSDRERFSEIPAFIGRVCDAERFHLAEISARHGVHF
ncbi:MAG: FAD-dependent oxidoreductase [Eubacteriales bacterium]